MTTMKDSVAEAAHQKIVRNPHHRFVMFDGHTVQVKYDKVCEVADFLERKSSDFSYDLLWPVWMYVSFLDKKVAFEFKLRFGGK